MCHMKRILSWYCTADLLQVFLTWKMLTWMYGMENIALHTSIHSKALRGDWKPETWISSQYCEYSPSVTISMVLSTRARECPLR